MTTATIMGHQRPRIFHAPRLIDTTVQLGSIGREVVDLAAGAGLILDDWEAWVIEESAATRDDRYWNPYTRRFENKWAAFEVKTTVSRQNGKGSIIEARELAGMFLLGERLQIHTAHQFDTSKEAFERIMWLIENTPDLDRKVQRVSRSHGEEGIEVKPPKGSGLPPQRLRFRTRTSGGGRGFTGDTLYFDEDMILGPPQIGAIFPTLSARPNPQVWYMGSAGTKTSLQAGHVRARALRADDPKLAYYEWSAELCGMFCHQPCDVHDQRDNVETYAKSNPGLGIRISVEHVDAERRSMDIETFNRERLGVGDWPAEGDGWKIIGQNHWESRIRESSVLTGKFALAIDTAPDRSWSCIMAAGLNSAGDTHVEITSTEDEYDYRPGLQWVVDRVVHIWKTQKPACVVIDPAGQAASIIDQLEAEGVKVIQQPNSREFAQACGDFYAGVVPSSGEVATVVHIGQAPLTSAIAGAEVRQLAGLWAWSKTLPSVDVTPLVAATLAAWGFKKFVYRKKVTPFMYRR